MNRINQQLGQVKWYADHLQQLQSEPLKALDLLLAHFNSCVVSGCEVSGTTVASGLISFKWTDVVKKSMIVPFDGATGVVFPTYFILEKTDVYRNYENGGSKVFSENYKAVLSSTIPSGSPAFALFSDGATSRLLDVIQSTNFRFVTDANKTAWNAKLNSSSYTADDVLAKIKTLDGAGSGLDADLLDGYHASAFLLAASYTAADVLAKILTVDGANSGLDADTLDGQHLSYFTNTFALKANPTFTGTIISPKINAINVPTVRSVGSVSFVALNFDTDHLVRITALTSNCLFGTSGTPIDGQVIKLTIKSASQRTLNFESLYFFSIGYPLPSNTVAGKTMRLEFVYDSIVGKLGLVFLSVDGEVSFTNADTLDGQHGSYYAALEGAAFTGLITAPKINATNILTMRAITSTGSVTLNSDTDHIVKLTGLVTSCTFDTSGTPSDGQVIYLRIKDNGGAHGLIFLSPYFAAMGVALPTNTVAGKTMNLTFMYDSAISRYGLIHLAQQA